MALHLPAKDDPRWCLIAAIVVGIAVAVAFYKAMYPHAMVLVATALVLGIIYAKDRGWRRRPFFPRGIRMSINEIVAKSMRYEVVLNGIVEYNVEPCNDSVETLKKIIYEFYRIHSEKSIDTADMEIVHRVEIRKGNICIVCIILRIGMHIFAGMMLIDESRKRVAKIVGLTNNVLIKCIEFDVLSCGAIKVALYNRST